MTESRLEALARTLFNAAYDYPADDHEGWDAAPANVRNPFLVKAEPALQAVDAADDRVRLTMPQFLDIKAQTVSDLSIDLHSRHGGDAGAKDVLETVENVRANYADRFLPPIDPETAMASLVQERLAIALRATADSFDRASLQDITAGFTFEHGMTPRTIRKVISGCADWLRTHADDLDAEPRRPYRRVDRRAVIDEDRYTALRRSLERIVRRSRALAEQDRVHAPFIMTADIEEALARDAEASVEA
jgi:hypothetical protein